MNYIRKKLLRRAFRGIRLLISLFVAFSLIGSVIPFLHQPALTTEAAASVESRADEMQHDIDTPDRVMMLPTSTSGLDERLRLMSQAKREIIIVTYECHDGESTRDIIATALHMADRGVHVRFLVDGIAGRMDHMGDDLFGALAVHPNVEIRFYNLIHWYAPWKYMGRMHDKYVIVDDTAYILGGRNMFDKFLGDYPSRVYSIDREVLVYNSDPCRSDSSLYSLRDYFEGMWNHPETSVFDPALKLNEKRRDAVYISMTDRYDLLCHSRPELFEPFDYQPVTVPARGIWLISNPTDIYAKQPVVFAQLAALMRRADRDVVIHSPYAVLNGHMTDSLAEIAGGVPVTLMVNAVENGANLVASSDYLYHRSKVCSTGVSLLEYAGGKSYHGKAIAIDDDISIIGSFNLDMRSAYIDTELMLVIRSDTFNAQLRKNMDELHADCRIVGGDGSADIPEGLDIPPLPLWKKALLYTIGLLLQPVRLLL